MPFRHFSNGRQTNAYPLTNQQNKRLQLWLNTDKITGTNKKLSVSMTENESAYCRSHTSECSNTIYWLKKKWKWPILWHKTILFLHRKAFTERNVWFLIEQSGLCVDCCRIMWGIQHKVLLNIYFRILPSLFPVKMAAILLLDKKEK